MSWSVLTNELPHLDLEASLAVEGAFFCEFFVVGSIAEVFQASLFNVELAIDDAWAQIFISMHDDVDVVFSEEVEEVPIPMGQVLSGSFSAVL